MPASVRLYFFAMAIQGIPAMSICSMSASVWRSRLFIVNVRYDCIHDARVLNGHDDGSECETEDDCGFKPEVSAGVFIHD
jgi:hypothetical protein